MLTNDSTHNTSNIVDKSLKSTDASIIKDKKITALAKKNAKRKDRERKKSSAKAIKEWLKGKRDTSSLAYDVATMLRFLPKANEVETSRGARVPAPKAQLLYSLIKKGADVTGATIGMYTVNSATDEGATIGCHFIPMEKINRFARVMGWNKPQN